MRQSPPTVEDEPAASDPVARQRPARGAQQRWDWTVVGIMTPTLLATLLGATFVLGQIFYPDPDPPRLVFPTPRPARRDDTATTRAVVEPIDTVRVNTGVVDRPLPFEWPEVDELKVVPNPGRPSEQADYKPAISAVELRRLFEASSVSVVQHGAPAQAQAAAAELAKGYPLRSARRPILDLPASAGYLADETGFGVVFAYGGFRASIETMANGPISPAERVEIEYQTLHLADHIARRLQEIASSGRRTGPEATAVHWRDHLARSLPFGR
jgi:hypothetical protein